MTRVTALPTEGKAVIIITHDEEVPSRAQCILVMRGGLVTEERVMEG